MSAVTREAIEGKIGEEVLIWNNRIDTAAAYDNLSDLVSHDLAELCRLGKAVLECFHYTDGTDEERDGLPFWLNVHTPDGDIDDAGTLLAHLFAHAGVERPET